MSRVLLYGIDSASYALIQRWRSALPTFNRLVKEGTWGVLKSTIPPFTSPAWACMMTGKNPAKVGIYGLRHRQKGTYNFLAPTSADRHAPALWDITGQAGLRSIVLNVPDTYPPLKINGVMVSGRPASNNVGSAIVYPDGFRKELDRVAGGYVIGPPADFDEMSRAHELEIWTDVVERQGKALEYLLTSQAWDIAIYVSMAVDGISHHFWKYLDPQHPDHDPDAPEDYTDTIYRIYQLEDRRLSCVLNLLNHDDLLVVVSDHGSISCYQHISVNRWLIDQGYLVLSADKQGRKGNFLGRLAQSLYHIYRKSSLMRQFVKPLRKSPLRDMVVEARFEYKTGGRIPMDALSIDWNRTSAYYLGDDRLYLNVKNREPEGKVFPGEDYNKVRSEIRQELLKATHPVTGESLFRAVYNREEIYDGPYMEDAPDLILVPGNENWNIGGAVGDVVVDRSIVSGKHHPEGVYIAWGKGIKQAQSHAAHIYDIAPTILHFLDIPVPKDADGLVQFNWFNEQSDPVNRKTKYALYEDMDMKKYQWTSSEKSQIETRMRDLGYLD